MNSHRKMTPKGQMSSSGMGPAITHLPPHLKALFDPNPPLEHKPPITKRKMPPYSGMTTFVDQFEHETPPQRVVNETPRERRERLRQERMAQNDAKMQEDLKKWDPQAPDDRKTEDAYKTLFVGRISYETTEKQLRQEFEHYGPVKRIRLVEDEDGKSRGYAFIEYEEENDMKAAFKHADGKKIDGRRVVVDVERGRTVRDWKPRKFGGGIGDTRKGGNDVNVRYSGREPIHEVKVGGGPRGSDSYGPGGDGFRGGGMGGGFRRDDGRRDRSRDRGGPPRSRGGDDRRDRRRSISRSRSRDRDRDRDRHRERDRHRGRDRDRDRYRERDRSGERRGSREHRDRRR